MAFQHQHRTGPTALKTFPVKIASSVKVNDIEAGDLVALETNTIKGLVPVTAWVWDTSEAVTSDAFALAFAGVAAGRSNKDVPTDHRDENILVTQDGEFEVVVESGTYIIGTLLKPKKAAGNALTNVCTATTDLSSAIFAVSEHAPAGSTKVKAYILKTLPKRMNNTNA